MATRIKLRRDTSTNWTSVDPILANGEMGIEADTRRVKVGDGSTKWSELKYAITDQLKIDGKTVSTELGMSIASQDPETWIATVKAKANWAGTDAIAYDDKGNLYLSGWEEYGYDGDYSNASGKSFLTKFDSQGSVVWSKYILTDSYANGGGVVIDHEGNIITSTIDWDDDYFVITKFDMDGTVIWQKTYRDSYDYAMGVALAVDSLNNIIVCGTRGDDIHSGERAIFAMKVSGFNGAISWTKTAGYWGIYNNQPCLTVDSDDNVIMGSWQDNYSDGRVNIIKLDTNGDQVWTKLLMNPSGEYDGYELSLGSLDSDESGNIYYVGSYVVPDFVRDIQGDVEDGRASIILKMNSDGVVQWSRIVGPGDCNDMGAQVVYKEGKLYATFQTERKYYKNDVVTNVLYTEYGGFTTQEIVVACYDADNGRVLWQNNLGPDVIWGYASPSGSPNNYQDTSNLNGRMIAVHGDYVAIAGQAGEYSRIDDTETRSYGFVAQVPATGENLDIAGWKFTTSRHPGQYAKVKAENWADLDLNNTYNIDVTGSNEYTPTDTEDNVRYGLIASGANQWDFKPNGDLALPVNGNLEFRRKADGDINIVGFFDGNNGNSTWNRFNSVTTDPDGNRYYVGVWNGHGNWTPDGSETQPMVVKVNKEGQVEWKSKLSNTNLYGSDSVQGEATTVAYDPSTGNIVVVAYDSSEGNNDQMLVVDMNPSNGSVVASKRYADTGNGYLDPYGIVIDTDGNRFITGQSSGGGYEHFTVTNSLHVVGHNDTLLIPKTLFAGHDAPDWLHYNDWYITDPGYYNVDNVDYYPEISGTVRQGSGATFDVTADGAGGYTVVQGAFPGEFYQVGHTILVTGDQLGGATPANDATIRVETVDNPLTGVITSVSISGTSTGSNVYTALSGTNTNVGSGFTIGVQVNSDTGALIVYHQNGGTNYVVNDVITFTGTDIGGTSTATDIVITALDVGLSVGDVQPVEDVGYQVTQRGLSPLTYVRVKFTNGTDLSTGGPWQLTHYTSNNSYIVKLDNTGTVVWSKHIDKENSDLGAAVDYDSDGNLYWLNRIYDEEEPGMGNWRERATVVKLNSLGEKQWIKSYAWDGYEGQPIGIQVDSEDKVVFAYNKWNQGNYEWDPVITRILPNGNKLWEKRIILDGGEGNTAGLALDNDDNIYVATERYNDQNYCAWIAKLDIQDGDTIWQQDISNEEYNLWPSYADYTNIIAVDGDKYHIATQTWDLDGNEGNAMAVSLPADGSASGQLNGDGGTVTEVFAVDATWYNTEGGNQDVIDRNYAVGDHEIHEVTNREPIQAWMITDSVSFYPVYTKSDAGITFADGTVQTTSAAGLPQVRRSQYAKRTKLKLGDQGKHIYITNGEQNIIIPPYSEVPFEVGAEITIVNLANWSNTYVLLDQSNQWRGRMYSPELDGYEGSVPWGDLGMRFYPNGGGQYIKLLKVEESYSNGSVWVITYQGGEAYWN